MPPRSRQWKYPSVLSLCALTSVVACSKSPSERARKASETLHSWASATAMVGNAWTSGRVPTPYVTRTLEVAAGEIRKQAEQLAGDPSSRTGEQVVAAARLLSAHVGAAQAAAERGDRRSGAAAAAMLAADDSALARLERRLKSESR